MYQWIHISLYISIQIICFKMGNLSLLLWHNIQANIYQLILLQMSHLITIISHTIILCIHIKFNYAAAPFTYTYEMKFTLCVLLVYNDNGSVQTLCITRLHPNARYAKCLHRPIVIINQQYTKGKIHFINNNNAVFQCVKTENDLENVNILYYAVVCNNIKKSHDEKSSPVSLLNQPIFRPPPSLVFFYFAFQFFSQVKINILALVYLKIKFSGQAYAENR